METQTPQGNIYPYFSRLLLLNSFILFSFLVRSLRLHSLALVYVAEKQVIS